MLEVLQILGGLIVGVLVDMWGRPAIERWLKRMEIQRAKRRYGSTGAPNPPKEFANYGLGNIEVAVMNLVGSPETPFGMNEVKVDYKPVMYHQQPDYPVALADAKSYLEEEYLRKSRLKNLTRTELPRLTEWEQEGETAENKRGPLRLSFTMTTFDTYLTTNRSLDHEVIPESGPLSRFSRNQSIRQAFVRFPYYLETSVLSNPLAVIVVVISRNLNQDPKDQVIIRLRSKQVASYRNRYQVSAAGYTSLAHRDDSHMPNPFVTAVCEAREEISDGLQLSPSDFRLIGLSISWEDMLPCAYGYIETGLSVEDLFGDFRRDTFEGWLEAIPFEPRTVLTHIAQHKWTPESVLAMCATLLAYFPRERVEAIARTIPAKVPRDFYEDE